MTDELKPPKTIYLQWDAGPLAENTWSEDRINDDDIKYTRSDMEWIPVSERLPDENVEVLILVEGAWGNYVHVGTHFSDLPQWNTTDGLYYHGHEYKRVTHWMPLPEAPKEDVEQVSSALMDKHESAFSELAKGAE